MLPRVVYHVEASLDGRTDYIAPDIGRYYRLAANFGEDAAVTGADTVLRAPQTPDADLPEPPVSPDPPGGALMVVTDSRGRVHVWNWLRSQTDYWRDVVALCSQSTPAEHLRELQAKQVDHLVAGHDRVDLRAALEWLNDRHGVETLRIDSGGALAGAFLRAGLVDEVSLLVEPLLVGGTSARSFFRAPDLSGPSGLVRLELLTVERFNDDVLWLRYEVAR
jgi:2,5-diamino-6-(ribosylamino)-4(3H)-pyrimidinone 5'-phosphate reductase